MFQPGLFGDLGLRRSLDILSVLHASARGKPEGHAGLGILGAKQQQAVAFVEQQDPHRVANYRLSPHTAKLTSDGERQRNPQNVGHR